MKLSMQQLLSRYYFESGIQDVAQRLKIVMYALTKRRSNFHLSRLSFIANNGGAIKELFNLYRSLQGYTHCNDCGTYHAPGQADHSFWFNVIGVHPQDTLAELESDLQTVYGHDVRIGIAMEYGMEYGMEMSWDNLREFCGCLYYWLAFKQGTLSMPSLTS
jgi:hypothetical protein